MAHLRDGRIQEPLLQATVAQTVMQDLVDPLPADLPVRRQRYSLGAKAHRRGIHGAPRDTDKSSDLADAPHGAPHGLDVLVVGTYLPQRWNPRFEFVGQFAELSQVT